MIEHPLLTVVICTRNRAFFVEKCIKSLLSQNVSEKAYEILIVDNGSTDSTSKVIRKYVDGVLVRSIFEPVVGLSRSRNTGWRAAKGQYVGYIDDDAVAGTEWVENAISVSKTVKPYPDIIGGPIFLEWEAPPPRLDR